MCGRNAYTCCWVTPSVDTSLLRCFEKLYYDKALGQLVLATRELTMSYLPPATELIKARRPLESFYMLVNRTYWYASAAPSIVSVLQVRTFLLCDRLLNSTRSCEKCFRLFILRFLLDGLVMRAVMYSQGLLHWCSHISLIWCFVRERTWTCQEYFRHLVFRLAIF